MKLLKVVIAVNIVVVSIGLVVFIGASMYAVTTICYLTQFIMRNGCLIRKEQNPT